VGTRVTIQGSSFFGGGASTLDHVTLNGVATTITSASDTEIVVVAHSGSGSGVVEIQAASGALTTGSAFTFLTDAVIQSFSPSAGQYGTLVTITGTGLLGGGASVTVVTLAGVNATVISSNNSAVIVAAGDGAAGSGSVDIFANTGATASLPGWTYLTRGIISAVSPTSGQYGTRVTIDGSNLRGGSTSVATVTLAGVPATVTSETNTQVIVTAANSSAQVGPVVVTSVSGASNVAATTWAYMPIGTITSFSPSSGQVGTFVTIVGTNLQAYGSAVSTVTLAGQGAQIVSQNNSIIVVRAAAGTPGQGVIRLVANSGAEITSATPWQYIAVGVVLSVNPSSGQAGASVVIAGSNLCGGGTNISSVTVQTFNATITRVPTCQHVEIVIPDLGTSGAGDIVLTSNTGAQVTVTNGWTNFASGFIATVAPEAGQSGQLVTISGERLFGGASSPQLVSLAGVVATIVTVFNDSMLTVRANVGPVSVGLNLGHVEITMASGVVIRKVNAWTYSTVDSLSPASGQQGTVVTITGVRLLGNGSAPAAVSLGGTSVTEILSYDASTVVVRAGIRTITEDQSGLVSIVSSNGQTIVSSANLWTYKVPGSITSVTPASGQAGTRVTIAGVALLGYGSSVANVTLAGQVVTNIISATNSSIEVLAPVSGATAAGNVVVTSNTGAVVRVLSAWAFVAPGVISSVVPPTGQENTRVTISGTGLLSGGGATPTVTLAGLSVSQVVSANDTQIVVVAAVSNVALAGDVRIVSTNGAPVVSVNGFTYALPSLLLRDSKVHACLLPAPTCFWVPPLLQT